MYDVVPKEYGYTYGKANCGLSTDVKNAAIGYLLASKHKIQKWLNNLVCRTVSTKVVKISTIINICFHANII